MHYALEMALKYCYSYLIAAHESLFTQCVRKIKLILKNMIGLSNRTQRIFFAGKMEHYHPHSERLAID